MTLRLGIDVGGTNTDAVVLDEHANLLASFKSPTTPDVTSGIRNALHGLVGTHPDLDLGAIKHAMLGTTHCTNAILERSHLNRVGLIRIGAPATLAIPPYVGWPADLRAAVGGQYAVVEGGHEYDGREIRPLDLGAIEDAAESFKGKVDTLAVVGAFAAVDSSHERRAAEVLRDVLGDLPLTYSHEIGSLGLLERENASILNAAVVSAARAAASGFERALRGRRLDRKATLMLGLSRTEQKGLGACIPCRRHSSSGLVPTGAERLGPGRGKAGQVWRNGSAGRPERDVSD